MNKKGVTVRQILYTVYILLATLFLVTSINYINSFRGESGFSKEGDVRNTALFIYTAYMPPGKLQIIYEPEEKYIYEIEDGFVKLSKTNDIIPSKYRYAENNFFEEIKSDSEEEKDKIIISKDNQGVEVNYG